MLIDVVTRQPEFTAEYVPYAKHRLRELRKQWQGYVLSQVTTIDKVRIQLEVLDENRGRVTLTASMGFMETAFLDVHGYSGLSSYDFRPAFTYLNQRISSLSASLPNAYGHKVVDGGQAWGFAGCSPATFVGEATVPDPPPGEPGILKSDPPMFCGDDLLARKHLMKAVKPSTFTGKMKLYVQALYGSDRRTGIQLDYSRTATGELSVLAPEKDGDGNPVYIKMGSGVPTTGLIKVGANKYLMVEIYADAVQWRHMISDNEGMLTPGTKLSDEAEAYHLSRLSPSAYTHVADGAGIEQAVKGRSVLAYGWHFARSKLEASIVSFVPTTILAKQMFVNASGTTDAYHFQLWALNFAYDAHTDKLSYTLTKGGEGDHIPNVYVHIWTPYLAAGIMMALMPSGGSGGAYGAANVSAPIYCYYDAQDTLAVVTAKCADWAQGAIPPTTPWEPGPTMDTIFGHNVIYPLDVSPVFHKYYAGPKTSGLWGVDISGAKGASYLLTASANSGQESLTFVVQAPGGEIQNYSYMQNGVSIYAPTYALQYDGHFGRRDIWFANGAYVDIQIFCAIPFDDASAIVIGMRKVKHSPNVQYSVEYGGSVHAPYKITYSPNLPAGYDMYAGADEVPYVLSHNPEVYLPWSGYSFGGGSVNPTYDQSNPNALRQLGAENFFNSVQIDSYLHDAFGSYALYSWSWSNQNDYAMQPPPNTPYVSLFEPSPNLPFYLRPMRVTTSYFGEYRTDYCLPPEVVVNTTYSDGWPNVGDNTGNWGADVAVGWA